jgi:hypothetical protein
LRIAKSSNVSSPKKVPENFQLYACFFSVLSLNEGSRTTCIPGWHIRCKFAGGMNLRDLLIIYLACGAPFGVYYFLQNRNRTEIKFLWLKSLFRFVFWIPFALQMVARTSLLTNLFNSGFDQMNESDAKKAQEIERIKKNFEKNLIENNFPLSIFEFREIFDRYVGLSLEIQNENQEISPAEQEIFRITNHGNKKLGEICLNRRNRKRLTFHQKLARRDIFEIFRSFVVESTESQHLIDTALKLADLLGDFEVRKLVENLSNKSLQTQEKQNVRKLENELWKSENHKLPADPEILTNLQALTATANLSNND